MEEIYKLALTDNPVDLVVDKNLKVSSNVNSIAEEPYCMYKIMPTSYGKEIDLLPNGKEQNIIINVTQTKPLHGLDEIVMNSLFVRQGGSGSNHNTLLVRTVWPSGFGDSMYYSYSLKIKIGNYDKWFEVGSQTPVLAINSILPSDYYDYIYNKINESVTVQFKLRSY